MSISKVNLIDPINIVSKFGANYNGIPDYEKMSIFVELTVTRRGKSILIASDQVKQDLDSTNVKINMLGFEQSKSSSLKNYHTTNWTDNSAGSKTRYEGFGIQSINIAITPSAVPIVNIEFIDVKGMNLLNKGEDSPYAVIYDFPPPIFTLSVKGYYGKKITYTLHLLEQNTRFDGTSGNYLISAKFTSRTFSPLTDILFNYIRVVPYMDGGKKINFDELESSDIPPLPTNTYELIRNLKLRNSQIAKLNNTSEELKTSKTSQLKVEKIRLALESIDSILFENSIDIDSSENKNTYTNQSRILLHHTDYNKLEQSKLGEIEILTNTSAYNKYIIETDAPTNTDKKLILAIIDKKTINGNSNVNVEATGQLATKRKILDNIIFDKLDKILSDVDIPRSERKNLILKTSTTRIPDYVFINGSITETTSFVGIDITNYYIKLYNTRNVAQKEYETSKSKYDEKVNDLSLKTLGFKPYPNNVFKILANDCDLIFNKLSNVGSESDNHHEKYRNQIISSTNSKNNSPIGAFPLCFKQTTTRSSEGDGSKSFNRLDRAFPSEIQQFVQLPEPFPEVNFVNEFINASISLSKIEKVNDSKEQTDVIGNNLWFPINPVDTTLKLNYTRESPYYQIERKRRYQLNELYDVILNRYYIISQYTCSDYFNENSDYVRLVAKSEALNLTKSFIDKKLLGLLKDNAKNHKTYSNFIEYVSNPKNGVKYYSSVNTTGTTDFIKFDNSEILFYRTRTNDNFKGFDYTDNPVTERISQENSDDILDQFIEEQKSTWTKVTKFFTASNSSVQKFSKENLIYFPDQNKNNDEYDSKFLGKNGIINAGSDGLIDIWSEYLVEDLNALKDVFTGDTYTDYQRLFFMITNLGYTRSLFSVKNDIRAKFSVGSVVQIPNYSNLYMGALALAYHDELGNVTYSNQIDDLLNNKLPDYESGDFINSLFFDKSNLNFDKNYIKNLSKNDAQKFIDEFNKFLTGEEYGSTLDSIIDIIENTTIPDDQSNGDSKKQYEDVLRGSSFIKNLARDIFILNFSDITFSSKNKSIDKKVFIPIKNISSSSQQQSTEIYFKEFFAQLANSINDRNEELDTIDKDIISKLNDNDVKNQMYYSFKTIYDRWIPSPNIVSNNNNTSIDKNGFPLTGKPLFDSFRFVDRANNDIGDKVLLNIDSLIDMENDFDLSVFQVISRILSENGFEFFPIENFMVIDNSNNKWEDAFKIFENVNQPSNPYFIAMYIGGTSSTLDNKQSQTENTGIKDLENDIPVDFINSNSDDPFYANVNAFRVRFGEQNQSFFTDIQFDQKEFTETNESLSILASIADDQGNSSPVPKGQNLFNVYSQRSYTAKVTGLGNAMIQPMQYFQIENIPMFNGAYIILKVDHQITANHMTTSFEGMRLAKIPVPFVSDSFTSGKFNEQTSTHETQQQSPNSNATPNSVVNNSSFTTTNTGGSPDNSGYPNPPVAYSMDNLFSTVNTVPLKTDNS